MSKLTEILKNKKRRIISSEEALKDIEPLFTEEEIEEFINNPDKQIVVK